MFSRIKTFIKKDEDGAVSVDWVVLTAAIIGLALGTITLVQAATVDVANRTSDGIADQTVGAEESDTTPLNTGSGS